MAFAFAAFFEVVISCNLCDYIVSEKIRSVIYVITAINMKGFLRKDVAHPLIDKLEIKTAP